MILTFLGLLLASCRDQDTPRSTMHPSPSLRVALCQIEVGSQPEVNLARLEAAIAEAADGAAAIACFPEACVFGWVNPAAHEEATPIPGAITDRIASAAKHHGLMIVLGLAERHGSHLFNSVVLIDRDGSLLLRHRKVNILGELMTPPYSPGPPTQNSVVDTRFGRIGLLVCADTFQESLVDQLAEQKPDLVVVPYGWAAPAADWPGHGASLSGWIARTARKCRAPVIGVDSTGELHAGPWKGYVLGGQSAVSDPAGNITTTLADRNPELRIVEIKLPAATHEISP